MLMKFDNVFLKEYLKEDEVGTRRGEVRVAVLASGGHLVTESKILCAGLFLIWALTEYYMESPSRSLNPRQTTTIFAAPTVNLPRSGSNAESCPHRGCIYTTRTLYYTAKATHSSCQRTHVLLW